MKTIILLSFITFLAMGCQKSTAIGYLETSNAMYSPDSIVVKVKLSEDEDAYRIEHEIPWQSNAIDGVQGTLPLYFLIAGINGEQTEIMDQFRIKPNGVIEIPFDHQLAEGQYVVSVKIGNKDHGRTIDAAFTVIVK